MATLNFSKNGQWFVSEAITPTDSESVIVNITSRDVTKTHKLIVEHSINKEFWMVCGSISFTDGIELSVNGVRAGEQYVRFRTETQPLKAECL